MKASEALRWMVQNLDIPREVRGRRAEAYDALADAVALAEGLERLAAASDDLILSSGWQLILSSDDVDGEGMPGQSAFTGPTPLAAVTAALAALEAENE